MYLVTFKNINNEQEKDETRSANSGSSLDELVGVNRGGIYGNYLSGGDVKTVNPTIGSSNSTYIISEK